MNYEELLDSRNTASGKYTQLPFGVLHKQQIDGKFENVVDIRPSLVNNLRFYVCLKKNCEANQHLKHNCQLHFSPMEEVGSIRHLIVERGQFISLAELLHEDPAKIGQTGFIEHFVTDLLEYASWLHQQGIYHVCFSPTSVLLRKGGSTPYLLAHGSFFMMMANQRELYEGMTDYVAPEVLTHSTVDERCDIYSIGKLMEQLFTVVEMPLAYKRVIAKATATVPEDRYQRADEMLSDIHLKKQLRRSVWIGCAVIAALLIGWGVYTEMTPEKVKVEYVKPAKEMTTQEMMDHGINVKTELGLGGDSAMTPKQMEQQRIYEAKAESIFRTQYAVAAEKILSKIYNKSSANANEKAFMAKSKQVTEELMKAQANIAGKSAISGAKSQLIASQVIERITEQKKQEMAGVNRDNSNPMDKINETREKINKQLYEK